MPGDKRKKEGESPFCYDRLASPAEMILFFNGIEDLHISSSLPLSNVS